MRLSRLQGDALAILAALEAANIPTATSPDLLKIINSSRDKPVFAVALRAAMKTLKKHGLVRIFKNQVTGGLSYALSDTGRPIGIETAAKRAQEAADE